MENPEIFEPAAPPVDDLRTQALAELLGLLRAGELSAEAAFGRIGRRLAPAAATRATDALQFIQRDEQRHTQLLMHAADVASIACRPPVAEARRFFVALESRDLGVHLARITALDACVCQILSRILAANVRAYLPSPLVIAVTSIRRDEGHHVKIARTLALELGNDPARMHGLGLETRHAFDRVLACHEPAFRALGVDASALRRQIRRDAP